MEAEVFNKILFQKLSLLNPAVADLDPLEFAYALENIYSTHVKKDTAALPDASEIERVVLNTNFFKNIQLTPKINNYIVIDKSIVSLCTSLFAGIVFEKYNLKWIDTNFYFDVRAFLFFPVTIYFTTPVLTHLGGKPYVSFEKRQKKFLSYQGIGLREFKEANALIDKQLITITGAVSTRKKSPVVIAIAGPTAAGKTEFSEKMISYYTSVNKTITTLEMDNFFLDRAYRETTGAGSMSKESIHFEKFKNCLQNLKNNEDVYIPKYDFIHGLSSHDHEGHLKENAQTIRITSSDIIYLEGNFPFLFEEIIPLIDIKIMYVTDDPVRLKRKWKRDIDYRKKYNPNYLCNRFFRTQFLKAEVCYKPQLSICDIAVDTTEGHIYLSEEFRSFMIVNTADEGT